MRDPLLFSQVYDQLGEAVLISDHTGLILRANKAACSILGMPPEQLIGLTHDDPIWQTILESGDPVPTTGLPGVNVLRTGQAISNVELGVVRPDGTLVWIMESAAPIFDESNRLIGMIITFPDISASIKLRHELQELNEQYQRERDRANAANRMKSSFLANMSHEIRTPMTAILGFSEVLLSELGGHLNDHHATFLRSIAVSGKRLLELLNDILDLSKIEAGFVDVQKSELDISAEVEACATPMIWSANEKHIELHIELHPETIIIQGDRHRFGQVVTNLVSNAIKFTSKGSVTIRTGIHCADGERFAMMQVEDTGIGISEEFLPHLFEEFRQGAHKAYGGTGLGLAISERLVTRMGGSIEVESQEGRGTVFTILFPLVAEGREPIALPSESEDQPIIPKQEVAIPTGGESILVVEDNLETQRLLGAYLREQFRLVFAQNALQAFQAIRTEAPSLILMDINLPDRDGLSITREIRAGSDCPDVPIVALTAFAMSGDKQKFLEAGCTDYLSKPVTRREVLEVVNRLIKSKKTIE